MKWAIYNLLFAAVYPFLLPGFLVRMLRRGGYAARFWDRFALYPEGLFGKDRPLYDSHASRGAPGGRALPVVGADVSRGAPGGRALPVVGADVLGGPKGFVWIHAVSVGEVQVAAQLMREWRKVEPGVRFCFSTTSSTGWKIAEKELSTLNSQLSTSSDVLIYNPLDFPNFVKSALRTVRPRAIVLTESEIWPNFIRTAKKMGIPLYLINARVSDRSAPRYARAKWFFADVFGCFSRIFAQSQLDADRLVAAGAPKEKVEVTGSFKFDVARRNEAKERELAEWIFGRDENGRVPACGSRPRILLGGSTWPGEDEVLLGIYKRLIEQSNNSNNSNNRTILVIAPRHFEKADAVEANIRKAGFACIRRSRGDTSPLGLGPSPSPTPSPLGLGPSPSSTPTPPPPPVFLADTTGELMGLYGIADVVFVGKSLCAHGSQNMIEPCLCGKPTYVGPYTENFRPVMSDLLSSGAIVQVRDEQELTERICRDFAEPSANVELGVRALMAVESRCGVVAKCVKTIRAEL